MSPLTVLMWALCGALPGCTTAEVSCSALVAVLACAVGGGAWGVLASAWQFHATLAVEAERQAAYETARHFDLATRDAKLWLYAQQAYERGQRYRQRAGEQAQRIPAPVRARYLARARAAAGIAAALALCLLTGCKSPPSLGGRLTYFRDERTGLCFAGLSVGSAVQTITWVPCSPAVKLIPLEVSP